MCGLDTGNMDGSREKIMAMKKGKEKTEGLDAAAPKPTLEERLEGLNLQGEEEEDLNFSEEFEELIKDVH